MSKTSHHQPFTKMHGLGNDFVIFDARNGGAPFVMTAERARFVADRQRGVGCDQLVVLRQSRRADVFMEIWNADGSRVGACGNVTRCVGDMICTEKAQTDCVIETDADVLTATKVVGGIRVNMGHPRLMAAQIPLAKDCDTAAVDLDIYGLPAGLCTNVGNPHITFLMKSLPDDDFVRAMGEKVENHSLFPERVNVGFATLIESGHLGLKVWERGAGLTQACGTAACAAAVSAQRRTITGTKQGYRIDLDGGSLFIEVSADGPIYMTGPVAYVFSGKVALDD